MFADSILPGHLKSEEEHRREVCAVGRWIHQRGFVASTDGNISIRLDSRRILTSPTATSKGMMAPNDLVITDLQVGSMGGMAICLELRLEESGGRMPHVPILMLLDRRADVFLARRSTAEGWLVKPLDPLRIRKAVRTLLAGGTFHDETYKPPTVPVATASG